MPKIVEIVANPAVHFVEPVALADEPKLSPDEKLVALSTWENDATAMMVAEDEGMAPPANEVPLQDLVTEAKDKVLAEMPDDTPADPNNIDMDRRVKL